jgi:PAS domain S-box-containing protein
MQWLSNQDEAARLSASRRRAIADHRLQPVFDRIVITAAQMMGVPAAAVALRSDDGFRIQSSIGFGDVGKPDPLGLGSMPLPFVSLDANSPLVVADLSHDRTIAHQVGGVRYYASVPLRATGDLNLGVLAVMDTSPRAETSAQLMTILENLAALAVQQWELLAELREKECAFTRSEQNFAAERERWRPAVEANCDGLFELDQDRNVYYFSPRWKQFLGYHDEELPSAREEWLTRIHPADTGRVEAELLALLCGDKPRYSVDYRMQHRDGHWLWIRSRATAVRDEAGRVLRLVGVNSDITGYKESELRLNDAKEAAEAASRSKGDFLAIMSHEIRTPLNGVIGMSGLLLDTELSPRQLEFVTTIENSGAVLLALVNDILDLSKIDASKLELERVPFNLPHLIRESAGFLADDARRKGLGLRSVIVGDLPVVVEGDPGRLRQILLNLLSNAVKFTETGLITLEASLVGYEEDAAILRFEVADTGIGIPQETQGRLFQSFTQADRSITRHYGGTGLGLAIVKRLVLLMEGDIEVSSIPEHGATFVFTVKVRIARTAPLEALHVTNRDVNAEGKYRILVAEDNKPNRMVARLLLERAGFLVDEVENGQQAVEAVQRVSYDVVVMDCQMPRVDGLSATRMIRKLPMGRTLPIMALTANVFAEDRLLCEQAGMDDFLSKPFQPDELIARCLHWAQRNAGLTDERPKPASSEVTVPKALDNVAAALSVQVKQPDNACEDEDLARRALRLFVEECPKRFEDLLTAMWKARWQDVETGAHLLQQGACAEVSPALEERLSLIEDLCRHSPAELDEIDIDELVDLFDSALQVANEKLGVASPLPGPLPFVD